MHNSTYTGSIMLREKSVKAEKFGTDKSLIAAQMGWYNILYPYCI